MSTSRDALYVVWNLDQDKAILDESIVIQGFGVKPGAVLMLFGYTLHEKAFYRCKGRFLKFFGYVPEWVRRLAIQAARR